MAARLDKQVRRDGSAVLFVGAAHDVPAYLVADWRVDVLTVLDVPYILTKIGVTGLHWIDLWLAQHSLTEAAFSVDVGDRANDACA